MEKRISFEFKLAIMAIGAIALLCLTLQVYFQDYQKIGTEIENLNDIYQRSSLLNQVIITAQETEFAHQNYLLNPKEENLSNYYQSSFKLPVLLTKVQGAFTLRRSEAANVALVTSLLNQMQQSMRDSVKAYQETHKMVIQQDNESISRKLSSIISAMLSNESMALQEEQNLHNIRSQLQIKLYLVGSVVVLAVLAICMSLIIREVRENRKLAGQLQHNATHDFLTGLPNRAFFVQALNHTTARAKREGTLAILFFLDLNGFKHINDSYGHEIGDLVLTRVAEKLRTTMRESDILGRLGGDEFVILATKVNDLSEVDLIADKIANGVQSLSLPFLKEKILSTSIGHAIVPTDGETAETLIAKADKQMYEHKKSSKKPA